MSRRRMTMRAEVERNTASGTDDHNLPVAPEFEPLGIVPCFVWSKTSRHAADGEKTVLVEDLRGMFPLSADVRAGDEIARVTDRQDNELIPGRLRIQPPAQFKHSHVEMALERIQ